MSSNNSPVCVEKSGSMIERKYYYISRIIGILVSSVALLASVSFAALAVMNASASVDENIATPKISYSEIQRDLEAKKNTQLNQASDKTLQEKEANAAKAEADLELEKRLKPSLDSIINNIISYSDKVGQIKPSPKNVGDYIRQERQDITSRFSEDLGWGYVSGLNKATEDMVADSNRIASLPQNDPDRLDWSTVITGYTQSYINEISSENNKIIQEKNLVIGKKDQSKNYFLFSAIALALFVFGTILIALLRIERNTRPQI